MKFLEKLKKNWIRIWLLVSVAAFCSFIGYAVYTEVSSVKRVVSTTEAPGDPFSSNYMKTTLTSRRMSSAESKVTVCNYDQNYPLKPSTTEITYQMKAELYVKIDDPQDPMTAIKAKIAEIEDKTEQTAEEITLCTRYQSYVTALGSDEYTPMTKINAVLGRIPENDRTAEEAVLYTRYHGYVEKAGYYKVTKTADDLTGEIAAGSQEPHVLNEASNFQYTFGTSVHEKLKEKVSSTDFFKVTIDTADVTPDVTPDPLADQSLFFVYLTADAISGVTYDLYVRMYGSKGETEQDASWRGNIIETDYTKYDFYNYVITGSGVGSIDILWNDNYLSINKFFLQENGLSNAIQSVDASDPDYGTNGTKGHFTKKVTLTNVDSTRINRYELQLFKVSESASIGDPSQYIYCSFTKAASNGSGS